MFVKFEGNIINVNAIEKVYYTTDHITIAFVNSTPLHICGKKTELAQKVEELWELIQSVTKK